jgi:hypothetical protein
VLDDPSVFWPTLELGDAIGQLDADGAAHLRQLVEAICNDQAAYNIEPTGDGYPTWIVQGHPRESAST